MSHNYYAEINLHLTWHTKNSEPLLSPKIEEFAHNALRQHLLQTSGVYFHEVGGTETHVHLAVSIPPTLLICDFVGELKGNSSYAINQAFPGRNEKFAWQVGYGVVSFGTRDLDWVLHYIRNQKRHHGVGQVHDRLERITHSERSAETMSVAH